MMNTSEACRKLAEYGGIELLGAVEALQIVLENGTFALLSPLHMDAPEEQPIKCLTEQLMDGCRIPTEKELCLFADYIKQLFAQEDLRRDFRIPYSEKQPELPTEEQFIDYIGGDAFPGMFLGFWNRTITCDGYDEEQKTDDTCVKQALELRDKDRQKIEIRTIQVLRDGTIAWKWERP